MTEIHKLRARTVNDKCIVFSQWNRLLRIVRDALEENQIPCVSLVDCGVRQRSALIRKFRNDPTARVLLLSSRTESSGLTLIEANHVFLMEPRYPRRVGVCGQGWCDSSSDVGIFLSCDAWPT